MIKEGILCDGTMWRNSYEHDCPVFVQQHKIELDGLKKLVKQTRGLKEPMAEVGVCEGGSAWFIRNLDMERDFHLFDTFTGLPYREEFNRKGKEANEGKDYFPACDRLAKPLDVVKELFKDKPRMFFHQGIFPQDTGHHIEDMNFSLVHLDVDLYKSMKDCMEFFYPRMVKGGALIMHDFYEPRFGNEIQLAVLEFLRDKPEKLVDTYKHKSVFNTQVYIIKE